MRIFAVPQRKAAGRIRRHGSEGDQVRTLHPRSDKDIQDRSESPSVLGTGGGDRQKALE